MGDFAAACLDLEALLIREHRQLALLHRVDVGQRRQPGFQRLPEGVQRLRLAL